METRFIPGWKRVLVHHVRNGQTIPVAAKLTGVSMGVVDSERAMDEDFSDDLRLAQESAARPARW